MSTVVAFHAHPDDEVLLRELASSATALGAARVVHLGYVQDAAAGALAR